MAKEKTVYVCSNCGQDSPKWVGKCPSCGMWNTYVEEVVRKEVVNKRPVSGIETAKAKPITLHEIVADDEPRIDLHDAELNRVLGGGLVQGSLVLIGGEPGIGKSTLVLQTVLRIPEPLNRRRGVLPRYGNVPPPSCALPRKRIRRLSSSGILIRKEA